jgi:hypothetical protein
LSIPVLFSVVSLSSSCLRLLFFRPLGYLFTFLHTRFWLSPVIILRLPSLSSSSSILLLLLVYSRYRPSSRAFSLRRFLLFLLGFQLSSFVFLVFECALRTHCPWFNPHQHPYPHRSRLSSLFSPIDLPLNPSFFYPPSLLRITRPLPTIRSSTSSSCFDLLSTAVIVLRSRPSWVCRVSHAHSGFDVYPTLFWVCDVSDARGGCNVYPVLAFLFY